jgi:hypothetical protein
VEEGGEKDGVFCAWGVNSVWVGSVAAPTADSSGEGVRRESDRSCKAGGTLGSAWEVGGVWRGWDWAVGRPAASVAMAAAGRSPAEGSGSTVEATEGAGSTVEANKGAVSTVGH